MPYLLTIKKSALKELQSISKNERKRIVIAIDRLVDNPHGGKQLKGGLSGLRRIRVGNYRVVYEINDTKVTILVLRIAHRQHVYQ
ncbi:MAG: addiction module toxin RelE [Desulfobacteraceae bacterium 4572_35.2]|nr:MAG: addiction module toxin RelE [Desulfobacteraceae bacterium 4572_35.2]